VFCFFSFFFWVLIFASSNVLKEGIQSEEEDGMQFKSLTQNRQIGIFFPSNSR
jgi:hypothetical protein